MANIGSDDASALAEAFAKTPRKIDMGIAAVGRKAAVNIKRNLTQDAQRSRHFRQVARGIDFTEKRRPGRADFEVGPNKDRADAAKLANISYFGGANGGGGTLDFDGPAQAELDVIEGYLDEVVRGALP